MNKRFFLPVLALAFGLTACEDVQAPYEIDDKGGTTAGDVLLNETFSTSLGEFNTFTPKGSYPWAVSYSCAQVTSYVDTDGDGTKENVEAESWLVAPTLDLTGVESAHVSFQYILRYGNTSELETNYQLLVSKDYAGNGQVSAATWTALPYNAVYGADWDTWYESGNVNIPAEFCNTADVTVALCYKTNAKAATWEVKNFSVEKGAGDYTPGQGGDNDAVQTPPYQEAFSTTLGTFQNYTTDGSGEWVIDYSTAKATGWDGSTQLTTAGTYYLVSAPVSLAGLEAAHVSYDYILRYNKDDANQQLLVNANFDPANPTEGWELLNSNHTEGSDWATFSNADIAIPAAYLGQTVRFAFRYSTNNVSGSTWEVKNFSVQSGTPGDNTGGNQGGEITGDATLTFSALGLENAADLTTYAMEDGTTLTFQQGEGTNAPKYYNSGTAARMYAKNTLDIVSADKLIDEVVLKCPSSEYLGNELLTATTAEGTNATITRDEAASTVTISGINSRSVSIFNDHTENKAGVQLRIVTLSVSYVK